MTYGTVNVNSLVDFSGNKISPSITSLRNRIINGDMRIDQRNAGASVTPITATYQYTLDRWGFNRDTAGATVTVQQSSIAPAGFTNSFLLTVSTGASAGASDQNVFQQLIEGFNAADLGWGTANAQSITVGFWVRSSVTGTYGFSVSNSAGNRAYLATYTINAANTFEFKTITIPGDTTGTWLTNNGIGIRVRWDFGSGSSRQGTAGSWGSTLFNTTSAQANVIGTTGATFYITGVQLERGSTATSFDYRPYGTELALCQRYFCKTFPMATAPAQNAGTSGALGSLATVTGQPIVALWSFPVTMRALPTVTTFNPTAANANWSANPSSPTAGVFNGGEQNVTISGTTNTTVGNGYYIQATASIEL